MGLERFRKGLFGSDSDDEMEESVNETPQVVATPNVGGIENNKMILFEPRAYSESQQIANYLKSNNAVIVNLKRVTPDQAKRIVDFLSGTIYAIGGDLQKLGGGIFLLTPHGMNVEGKISDENVKGQPNQNNNPNKKKDNEDEEFDF